MRWGRLCILLVVGASALHGAAAQPLDKRDDVEDPFTMFVQTATSASLDPAGEGFYTLTLQGVSPSTVWFQDRPERGAGSANTEQFLSTFPLSPSNPANAALVASFSGNRTEDVIIVLAISSPEYDSASATLILNATILYKELEELKGVHNYVQHATRVDPEHDLAGATSVALMIDDCADWNYVCSIDCLDWAKFDGGPFTVNGMSSASCYSGSIAMCYQCAWCYRCPSWGGSCFDNAYDDQQSYCNAYAPVSGCKTFLDYAAEHGTCPYGDYIKAERYS